MTVARPAATAALLQVDAIVGKLPGPAAVAEVCRFLRASFPHYGWVGVYRLEGRELVLEAYAGAQATEHVRIPIDRGLCGRAARDGVTVVVDDVRASPEYLACFLSTRSEIVVPVHAGGRVVGEIDIDSDRLAAFDASDRRLLEEVAVRLSPAVGAAAPPR
ncbi:MAG TPA: GAF domain-containing protein [Thermoplasmata archaeon]|nr:GAF domain-containing protein [Thermoplasmata archaeon]